MATKDVKDDTASAAATTSTNKLFTRAEIAKHMMNNSKDVWIIIHNNVYNVTSFLNEHPGGEEVLMEQNGQDATEPFEDIGHSTDARQLMEKYKIGEIIQDERMKEAEKKMGWTDGTNEESSSSWWSWLIPIALGVLATFVYRYFISAH